MRIVVVFAIIALLLSFSISIGASDGNRAEPSESAPQRKLPLPAQVEQRRTEFHTQLEELQLAFAAETNAEAALELQRKITSHKLNFEIDLHRFQLDRFLEKGDSKHAAEIQSTIEALQEKLPELATPELEEEGQ